MLKIESKGPGAQIEATGSTMDLAVEAVALISGIYNQLKDSQPVAAKVFQGFIMKCAQEGGAGLGTAGEHGRHFFGQGGLGKIWW